MQRGRRDFFILVSSCLSGAARSPECEPLAAEGAVVDVIEVEHVLSEFGVREPQHHTMGRADVRQVFVVLHVFANVFECLLSKQFIKFTVTEACTRKDSLISFNLVVYNIPSVFPGALSTRSLRGCHATTRTSYAGALIA